MISGTEVSDNSGHGIATQGISVVMLRNATVKDNALAASTSADQPDRTPQLMFRVCLLDRPRLWLKIQPVDRVSVGSPYRLRDLAGECR